MISGSFGACASARRMSLIARSGSSASIAIRAPSFSAPTSLGSPARMVATSAALSAVPPVSASICASASCRSRVASEGSAPSRSWRSAAIAWSLRPWEKSSPAFARWNGRGSAAAAMRASSSFAAASGPCTWSRNCTSVSAGCGSVARSAAVRSTASAPAGSPARMCHWTSAWVTPGASGKSAAMRLSSSPLPAVSPLASSAASRTRCRFWSSGISASAASAMASASFGAPAFSRSAISTICAGSVAGASATTSRAVSTATARVSGRR